MKKILAILLALSAVGMVLTGCSGDSEPAANNTPATTPDAGGTTGE